MSAGLHVERVGRLWSVFDGDRHIAGCHSCRPRASARMLEIETARRIAARSRPRPCLRCQSEFISEGAHNRLCDRCRKTSLDRQMIEPGIAS